MALQCDERLPATHFPFFSAELKFELRMRETGPTLQQECFFAYFRDERRFGGGERRKDVAYLLIGIFSQIPPVADW